MAEKLGVENIEKVVGTLLDVGIQAYKAYADDNKIDIGEGIQLGFKVPAIWAAVKDAPEALAEGKDLDPTELEQLMNFVLAKLDGIVKI